jgi:preprotein translocase subunit YajC
VDTYGGLIFPALALLLLFMLFSRFRKQQRSLLAAQAAIRPGLRVMTTSGVYARVVSDDAIGSPMATDEPLSTDGTGGSGEAGDRNVGPADGGYADGATIVLEIAPGVHTRWARQAIAKVFDDRPLT